MLVSLAFGWFIAMAVVQLRDALADPDKGVRNLNMIAATIDLAVALELILRKVGAA